MAGRRKQPACRARGRQSPVGAALRPWHRRDERRFRDAGNTAIEPGAAGLAGHRADDERMETEGDHPLHRDVSHLPAVLERHAAAARAGPVQPAAGARSPVQARRRGHSRRPARGERAAQYEDVRAERIPVPAGGHLEHAVQQRQVDDERRRGSISAEHLHVLASDVSVSELHDVRRHQPRVPVPPVASGRIHRCRR